MASWPISSAKTLGRYLRASAAWLSGAAGGAETSVFPLAGRFGALFWFVIAGGPGALMFRLANTLDAMWGYRTPRYLRFGWAAARFDDVLNFIPARLTAATYALGGDTHMAWHCWRTQARSWDSPNAGPVMAAGAGSLNVLIGGPAVYHGVLESRPTLGAGHAANPRHVVAALRLVERAMLMWLVALLVFVALGVTTGS